MMRPTDSQPEVARARQALIDAVDKYDAASAAREHLGSYGLRIEEAGQALVRAIREAQRPDALRFACDACRNGDCANCVISGPDFGCRHPGCKRTPQDAEIKRLRAEVEQLKGNERYLLDRRGALEQEKAALLEKYCGQAASEAAADNQRAFVVLESALAAEREARQTAEADARRLTTDKNEWLEEEERLTDALDAAQRRIEELAPIVTELLRLYDWRFTLAEREKDQRNASEKDFRVETRRLLNQYGAEKKAAWEAARAALSSPADGALVSPPSTAKGEPAKLQVAEDKTAPLQRLLSWTQGCVVRSAHALALAADGRGIDGMSLIDTAVGVSSGLMDVDAAITKGEAPTFGQPPSEERQ